MANSTLSMRNIITRTDSQVVLVDAAVRKQGGNAAYMPMMIWGLKMK